MAETTGPNRSGSAASGQSLRVKTARFSEATSVYSPSTPVAVAQLAYPGQTATRQKPQLEPVNVSFGASVDHGISGPKRQDSFQRRGIDPVESPPSPPPKTPFTAMPLMSPTWKEEEELEKAQGHTDKEQAKDLKVKTRVRLAKFLLRGVNFSCSLIVLSMLSTSLTIFRTTQDLPPRYVGNTKLNPWAPDQKIWPQLVVLVISCISLLITIIVLYLTFRRGRRRSRKADNYYNLYAVGTWIFSMIMWILGATFLQHTRLVGKGQDFWGWSCVQNTRSAVYSQDIKYSLICRLQNWSLVCCIIEVVVETITVAIYAIIAYRFWSKRRLTHSMGKRNNARSDLYLAQLRASAPNTPAPWVPDAKSHPEAESIELQHPRPFVLQPAPASRNISPTVVVPPQVSSFHQPDRPVAEPQRHIGGASGGAAECPTTPGGEVHMGHAAAAPGEAIYEAVPVPACYAE